MFKLRSFYFREVDHRVFNAYFVPVGTYSGGEGRFWITESPKYFPFIERQKFYDGAVLWDFRSDEFDGQAVDQNKVVERYIMNKIISRGK